MSVRRLSNALLILCAVLVVWPLEPALAQQSELTLSQALERARNQAPVILAARDQIEEARGRLLGASLRFRENPTISAAAGRRNTGQTELDFSFTQPFEPGARRQARIAEAQAGVERQSSVSDNLVRRLLQEVAVAYLQAAAATQRIDVAVAADQVAGNLLIAMERRFELGDVPILDVNLARTAAARARSERRSSQAQLTEALANVRIFLGMSAEEPLSIASELPSFGQLNLANLLQEGEQRPDLRAVAAEVRQAEAEIRLGESFSRPDYGLGFSLEREEGELIAQGSVSISLPVFARGQELRATGTVRAIRLRRELEAARR
ncbi:MAG: TolC family protein, partial [Candidatus Korobacteraceae bacterium]